MIFLFAHLRVVKESQLINNPTPFPAMLVLPVDEIRPREFVCLRNDDESASRWLARELWA